MSHEPTIILVHGAFADASSWSGVVERLLRGGHHVVAPANPLRGLAVDSAYIASYISQVDGPTILVGHSYGGAVISNAATTAKNVLALVFVAAFAPENGETLGGAEANSTDSDLNSALVQRLYPTGKDGETAPEFIVDPAQFHDVFASDVPEKQSPSWPPRNVRLGPVHSARRRGRLPGKPSPRGRWLPWAIRLRARTSFVRWPRGQTLGQSRSRART